MKNYGSVTYEGKTYKTVVIGTQTWMAQNLNYAVEGSRCYKENQEIYCNTYGRLYDWSTAMNLQSSCNRSVCASQIDAKHKGICPSGWHIPSNADWDELLRYVDGTSGTSSPYESPTAGRYLKATNGFGSNCGPSGSGKRFLCEDTYGFAALDGGLSYGNDLDFLGGDGFWWSASEVNYANAYRLRMYYNYENAYHDSADKRTFYSVRCLQD